ncbi:unnamed protein product [Prunus brigantina]
MGITLLLIPFSGSSLGSMVLNGISFIKWKLHLFLRSMMFRILKILKSSKSLTPKLRVHPEPVPGERCSPLRTLILWAKHIETSKSLTIIKCLGYISVALRF